MRALLWDEPGVGKTPPTCAAIAQRDEPTIVVCPAVAVGVWQRELARWAPDFEVRTQHTTKPVDAPTGRQVLLTTYDRLNLDGLITSRFGLVLDEAHLVKNEKAKRSKKVQACSRLGRSFVWQLTGTPILRYPDDIWGQLSAMDLGQQTYGTKTKFCAKFGGHYGVNGMEWDPKRIAKTAYDPLRNFMLRRLRSEVLELPPRSSEEWFIELPKRLDARFRDICARIPPEDPTWEAKAAGGELASALADLSAVKAEASLKALAELEPSPDNPVVVFAAHKDAAKIVAHAMGWPLIDGDTPTSTRTAFADRFQAGDYAGIVLTIQAGGVGITLTRAKTVVFISETYTPAANEQAADRVYRFGQEREVRAIYVRAESPLEKAVQYVLRKKAPFAKIG